MATDIELGPRPLANDLAANLLVQASPPNQTGGEDAAQERVRSPQKNKSVLDEFLQNLMLALGDGPVY